MHILKLDVAIMALTASLCVSASIAAPQKGTMKDPRDEKTYKTVKIGDQVWMAENLALEITEINGNPGSTNECWILGGNGKKANCKKYGQYYSALAASVACPDGWHLPSASELKKLLDYTGNSIDLKSKKGWNTYQQPSGNGTDKYGFNALPSGGCIVATDGLCAYMEEGKRAYFWTSTVPSDTEGVAFAFLGAPHADYGFDLAPPQSKGPIWMFMPVRCIQDEKKNVGDENEQTTRGVLNLLKQQTQQLNQKTSDYTSNDCSTYPRPKNCTKVIDKVLEGVAGIDTKGKDELSKRGKEKDPSESSGGGIADGLAGLLSGGGGKIATKAKGITRILSTDEVDVTGSMNHERVMKVVRQRLPGLSHLYNKYLKKKPRFQGKIVLKLDVNANGQVTYISVNSSTVNYPEFENEIAKAVSRWKFENSTGNTIITIPCTFKINE